MASTAAEATTLEQAVELAFASSAADLDESFSRAELEKITATSQGPADRDSSLALDHRIFINGLPGDLVDSQAARLAPSPWQLKEANEFLAFDVVEAYLEVLRARDLVALAEANLSAHIAIMEAVQVTAAESRVAKARSQLGLQQDLLGDAEAEYARRIGQRPGELRPPTAPFTALPEDLAMAVEAARRYNLALSLYEISFNKTDQNIEFKSKINISNSLGEEPDSLLVQAVEAKEPPLLDWVFFAPEGRGVAPRGSLPLLGAPKTRHLRSPMEAERAMRSAWYALEASRQSITDLKSAVSFARETRIEYGRQFAAAERSLLDLLDAEMELFVSASELLTAETNEALAGYRILAVAGSLLSTLGVSAPMGARADQGAWRAGLLD